MSVHGNIILIGFMGTGKSETGRILASSLDLEFVDTDAEIEARSGKTIPELFKELGESGFRAIEKGVVNRLKDVQGHVISTGGGAVMDPENMRLFGEIGTTVHLTATPETILTRTNGDAGTRPMLAGTDRLARVNELLASRANQYAKAAITVDTTDRDPFDVARRVIDQIDQESTRIRVDLGAQSYDVLIGVSIMSRLGLLLRGFDITPRVLIVTNPGLSELYGPAVETSLRLAGFESSTIKIPDGESHKTLESARRIYDAMLDHRMDRKSGVIALGGGVIGDLSGFAAATFMRGVSFIQVPTSLLAQVDASVGGKVAVDHPRGKNLIGAFYQPKLVLISLDTLSSLPDRELWAGMAEVIKYGVIADDTFFQYLEKHIEKALNRDPEVLAYIVARSCAIKAEVVAGDEREHGRRAILNYGHTIGHAIETHTGILHGEAVSLGMLYAARIAHQMGLFNEDGVTRLTQLLKRAHLPTHRKDLDIGAILATMLHDKKTVAGQFRFLLAHGIGSVEIHDDVRTDLIEKVLLNS